MLRGFPSIQLLRRARPPMTGSFVSKRPFWNFAPQLPEAADLIPQPEQNQSLPFAADHFQAGFYRAAVGGAGVRFFFSHTYYNVSIASYSAYLFNTLVYLTMPRGNGDYRKAVNALIANIQSKEEKYVTNTPDRQLTR